MKFFLDTKFIEDGHIIDLISISLVTEHGTDYYAISTEFSPWRANDWVIENVLIYLPAAPSYSKIAFSSPASNAFIDKKNSDKIWLPDLVSMNNPHEPSSRKAAARAWKDRVTIAHEIVYFVKKYYFQDLDPKMSFEKLCNLELPEQPEFWADYAATDWVAFYQLFGKLIDLPTGFPMFCHDIQQLALMLGNPKLPTLNAEHHALSDARNCKERYLFLQQLQTVKSYTK